MSEHASKKQVSLIVKVQNDMPFLLAERLKVKQIVLNLVSNALKFTPENGTVKTEAFKDNSGSILFKVRDTGIGISARDIKNVMEPFSQSGDTFTRSKGGTGLGLALVKSLTEMHGGSVSLESELGKGTVVTVKFPPERTQNP